MKLLFVDDDEHFLEGVSRHLSVGHEDVQFSLCETTKEARDNMTRETFDAIIADLRMPGEDGTSLLHFVRDNFPSMVRVILTALTDDQALKDAGQAAHHTFTKPCDIDEILATIQQSKNTMQ